jgi:long-chain acyl-CoA synthetase
MAEILRQILERDGDHFALADEGASFMLSEANTRTNRLIHGLRSLGLKVGDAIAVLSNNRFEWMETFTAVAHSGFVLVPVNWHLVADEIAHVLSDSGAKVLMAEADLLDTASRAVARAGGVDVKVLFGSESAEGWVDYEELLAAQSPEEPADQSGGTFMFYTSGTTGNPRGVRYSALQPGQPIDALLAMVQALSGLMGILSAKTLVNSPL